MCVPLGHERKEIVIVYRQEAVCICGILYALWTR